MTSRIEVLGMTASEYDAARSALLADAEQALRSGARKPQQIEGSAPQAVTAQSDAPTDGVVSTSRTPQPGAAGPRTVIGMTSEEYAAERKSYLARFK